MTSTYSRKGNLEWERERQRIYREGLMKAQAQPIGHQPRVASRWVKLPRIIFVIFHPAVIALAIMIGLLSFKVHQILKTGQNRSLKVKGQNKTHFDNNTSLAAVAANVHVAPPLPKGATSGRSPSSKNKPPLPLHPPKAEDYIRTKRFVFEGNDDDYPMLFNYRKRPVAETSVDDMLLDAETPLPFTECMPPEQAEKLDRKQMEHIESREDPLSEHNEDCTSNDDCLIISPYHWRVEGTGGPCRKLTFLRCNKTIGKCQCLDTYDLKWNTLVHQNQYQWNIITKTCYVRGTNPCKDEIPCAPGTTCRTTVSMTYNTPPMQKICECTDIGLTISAGDTDWWYCKQYWQRSWYYDLDNVSKMNHRPYHMFEKMKDKKNLNGTDEETKFLEQANDENQPFKKK